MPLPIRMSRWNTPTVTLTTNTISTNTTLTGTGARPIRIPTATPKFRIRTLITSMFIIGMFTDA